MTARVKKYQPEIRKMIDELLAVAAGETEPAKEFGPHCSCPHDCDFVNYCRKGIPDYSIYNLNGQAWKKIEQLRGMGIMTLDQVPDDFKLTKYQKFQVEAEKNGKSVIDKTAIKEFLATLEYPLYFLDFETIAPAIPPYDGLRPYQNCPFQFSLRIYSSPSSLSLGRGQPAPSGVEGVEGGKHIEFLGDAKNDPRPQIAELLCKHIGPKGSVVAYNSKFEAGVLKDLAAWSSKHRKPLTDISKKLWDMLVPFAKRHYVHPKFYGSASLKNVLPALAPSLTYEGLDIAEGQAASRAYLDLMSGKIPAKDAEKIRADLTKYCGQDTLAMVELLNHLRAKT